MGQMHDIIRSAGLRCLFALVLAVAVCGQSLAAAACSVGSPCSQSCEMHARQRALGQSKSCCSQKPAKQPSCKCEVKPASKGIVSDGKPAVLLAPYVLVGILTEASIANFAISYSTTERIFSSDVSPPGRSPHPDRGRAPPSTR